MKSCNDLSAEISEALPKNKTIYIKQRLTRKRSELRNGVLKAEQLLQVELSKSTSFSIEKLLAFSLFYSAIGSGNCFKQGLIALATQLTRDKKPLQCLDETLLFIASWVSCSNRIPVKAQATQFT